MNQKIKINITLIGILVCILFFRCSTFDELPEEHDTHFNENGLKIRTLTGKEVTPYKNKLEEELNNSNQINFSQEVGSSFRTSGSGEIDYNEILEVIDTTGAANYTFRIINHPDDTASSFHNLVLSQVGNQQNLTIIKYQYENNATEFKDFVGQITTRNLSTDIDNPCDPITVNVNVPIGEIDPDLGGNAGAVTPVGPGGGQTSDPPTGTSGSSGGGGSNGLTISYEPATFQCNSCNFSAHSWNLFSNHRDGNGTIYPFTIVLNFTTPTTDTTVTDPCDPKGSIGVLEDTSPKTPCEDLMKMIPNNSIQQTLSILKGLSSGAAERGNYIRETTNPSGATYLSYPVIPQTPSNPNALDIAAGLASGKVKGAMHCHTNPATTGMFPMFSDADLGALYNIAYSHIPSNNATKDYAEYTVMLSVGSGHYALKLKNFSGNYKAKLNANIVNFQKKLESDNKKIGLNASSTILVKTFLKNMKQYFGDEVGLYKATEAIDANGLPKVSGWKEQTLNENEDIVEINCQ